MRYHPLPRSETADRRFSLILIVVGCAALVLMASYGPSLIWGA